MDEMVKRIDSRLAEMGKTWADLGRAVGASDQRMYNWRSRSIPKSAMLGVAKFLGWTVDELLTGAAAPIMEPGVHLKADVTTTETRQDVLGLIADMMDRVTPLSRRVLTDIATAAKAGELSEEDMLLLDSIANRLKK